MWGIPLQSRGFLILSWGLRFVKDCSNHVLCLNMCYFLGTEPVSFIRFQVSLNSSHKKESFFEKSRCFNSGNIQSIILEHYAWLLRNETKLDTNWVCIYTVGLDLTPYNRKSEQWCLEQDGVLPFSSVRVWRLGDGQCCSYSACEGRWATARPHCSCRRAHKHFLKPTLPLQRTFLEASLVSRIFVTILSGWGSVGNIVFRWAHCLGSCGLCW